MLSQNELLRHAASKIAQIHWRYNPQNIKGTQSGNQSIVVQ